MFSLALESARISVQAHDERVMIDRFATDFEAGVYWAGCNVDVDSAFPSIEERKLWARVLIDTARAVFEREVGVHDDHSWQTLMIYLLRSTASLFIDSVRRQERGWFPETRDLRDRR